MRRQRRMRNDKNDKIDKKSDGRFFFWLQRSNLSYGLLLNFQNYYHCIWGGRWADRQFTLFGLDDACASARIRTQNQLILLFTA